MRLRGYKGRCALRHKQGIKVSSKRRLKEVTLIFAKKLVFRRIKRLKKRKLKVAKGGVADQGHRVRHDPY